MKLSIITINYNNAEGLRKTMESVLSQSSTDFEYIVVDGTPRPPKGGVGADCEVLESFVDTKQTLVNGFRSCSWKSPSGTITGGYYSERDSGIYNAMNKGIRMAKGEYIQFLNSGDILVSNTATERMLSQISGDSVDAMLQEIPSIFYGNMLKDMPKGLLRDKGFAGRQPTMLDFYTGTLNHSPAYIPKVLFERYGYYDEQLKIVSDWKWYLEVILLQLVPVRYVDVDVTLFDMSGISNSNRSLEQKERSQVLHKLLVKGILDDYEANAFLIDRVNRINRYQFTKSIFYVIERVLFQWEKRKNKSYIK